MSREVSFDAFSLTITLGNAAMMTRDEVATALRAVARRIEEQRDDSGKVRDENGNTVGKWSFE